MRVRDRERDDGCVVGEGRTWAGKESRIKGRGRAREQARARDMGRGRERVQGWAGKERGKSNKDETKRARAHTNTY